MKGSRCCWKEKLPSIKTSTHWPCRFLMPHQELSLTPNSPSSSVCLSNRKSAFPLHLLLSSLFHEYWGVRGGCPGAGHPVNSPQALCWGLLERNPYQYLSVMPPTVRHSHAACLAQSSTAWASCRDTEKMGFQCKHGTWVRTSCQSSCCTDGPK